MYVSNKLKMSFWGRIIYDITRLATWVIGKLMFRVSVENPGNVPKEGGLLIVSNHVSHLDPPLTGSFLPRRCGYHMAKMELFGIGILRVYMLSIGSIMVNRGQGKQALLDAVQYLRDQQVVFIFPEGTRSQDGVLMEGKSQTPKVLGASPWEYLSGSPEEAGRFGQAMTNMSQQAVAGITSSYDFSGIKHLVDVGGSRGALLLDILKQNPSMRGTVFDLPPVIEVTEKALADSPLRSRVDLVAGSFFESVPEGADAYMLKHILHDWPDEECLTILRTIRRAIPPHGRLLVFDALLVPEAPPWAHWLDVHMLVLQDGKERSPQEFAALLAEAGFEMTQAVAIPAPVAIIEAKPV